MKPEKLKASLSKLGAEAVADGKKLKTLRDIELQAVKQVRAAKEHLKVARRSHRDAKAALKLAKAASRKAAKNLAGLKHRLAKLKTKKGGSGKTVPSKASKKLRKAK